MKEIRDLQIKLFGKEIRDLQIKLFGKEIYLPEKGRIPVVYGEEPDGDFQEDETVIKKGNDELDTDKDLQCDNSLDPMEEDETQHDSKDDPKTPPIIEEHGNENPPDTENEANSSDQKLLKNPDKILPCPRCNSMDTKFCYYNNYNVNQPRHFCKGCHRYWTAGGTMRKVPVGAGRRKNKNTASNFRQITISEALANKVLSFGRNGVFQNGVFGVEKENGSDCSSGSSVITTSNSIGGKMRNASKSDNFNSQVPCFQGYPWPYSAMPNPGFCPPGYPIPVYPIPYWVPWIPPCGTNQILSNGTPNSPLGKHSRNGDLLDQNNPENKVLEEPLSSERSILIPKTLRIDDPAEAAKSSIWATLGIKNDYVNKKSIFKAFEAKGDETKNYVSETPSMRANPAAMSRSLNFLETA